MRLTGSREYERSGCSIGSEHTVVTSPNAATHPRKYQTVSKRTRGVIVINRCANWIANCLFQIEILIKGNRSQLLMIAANCGHLFFHRSGANDAEISGWHGYVTDHKGYRGGRLFERDAASLATVGNGRRAENGQKLSACIFGAESHGYMIMHRTALPSASEPNGELT